jgi:hypothetical protein
MITQKKHNMESHASTEHTRSVNPPLSRRSAWVKRKERVCVHLLWLWEVFHSKRWMIRVFACYSNSVGCLHPFRQLSMWETLSVEHAGTNYKWVFLMVDESSTRSSCHCMVNVLARFF